MDKIYLKNIKIYAYHGCMEEEKKIGSNYLINLTVHADLSMSCKSDESKDTVDYVALLDVVKNQMKMKELSWRRNPKIDVRILSKQLSHPWTSAHIELETKQGMRLYERAYDIALSCDPQQGFLEHMRNTHLGKIPWKALLLIDSVCFSRNPTANQRDPKQAEPKEND